MSVRLMERSAVARERAREKMRMNMGDMFEDLLLRGGALAALGYEDWTLLDR